ncbi:TPA: hypothetical protein N0F65_005423, partial [Lagenidium giganteum]
MGLFGGPLDARCACVRRIQEHRAEDGATVVYILLSA